jgi:tRNA(Ile)-lysidine synthetase-like protein
MGNMARDLRADEGYLSSGAEELLDAAQVKDGEITFPVAVLNAAPEPVAVRAIRMAMGRLSEGNDNCARVHMKSVLELSRQSHPSGQVSLPNRLTARREYGFLVLSGESVREELPVCRLQLPGETVAGRWHISSEEVNYQGEEQGREPLFLSCTGARRIQVRSRKTGDHLTRPSRKGKSLKKLMIEEKIPLGMRDQLPVLEVTGCVAAVAGLGPDVAFLPQKGERAWKITIHPVNDR